MKANFWQLTLITNKGNAPTASYLEFIETCLKAGVTSVQLREKTLPQAELLQFGSALKQLLDSYNIPLIVNDEVELCIKLDAFGVHLGQTDTEVTKARSMLGADKIIGLSVNNMEQIQTSQRLPIDYLGVGAIFPTKSKDDIKTLWGLSGLAEASRIASHPIVAIGGIDVSNAHSVIQAGADGIAAIGIFHQAADAFLTTENLIKIFKEARNDR